MPSLLGDIVVKTFLIMFLFFNRTCFYVFYFSMFFYLKTFWAYAESLSCYILICNQIQINVTMIKHNYTALQ